MGLLSPLLLLLAVAAAVPLLLHLLQRHQGPRVVFPALRYLRRAEKESARRIRLRQILLMLLRVVAVLLIALAAAQPFLRIGGTGHSPTAVVIVLDNSMSSAAVAGETRVLDELKARALEMLEAAGAEDRFWLLRAGDAGAPVLAGDAQATALRVRETEPTASAADLPAALARARALLAAGAGSHAAEIHLLSDLQATNFGAPMAADGTTPDVIVWHPSDAPPPGRTITTVEVGGGLQPVAGQRSSVTATIEGDDEEVNVRLSIGDRLVGAARARPGSSAVLALPPQSPGFVTGHVDIDADALRADDRRYFAANVMPPPRVALAGGDDAQPFIADALDVLAGAGRVQRTATGAADVIIAPAAAGVMPGMTGAVVIMPPTDPAELNAVNRRLAGAGVPWRYGPPGTGARFDVTALADAATDPLLRALGGVHLQRSFPLIAEPAASADSVLLRLADGGAWAVRGERAGGAVYVLLGSTLTADASNLPTSAAMLPLLDRALSAWALERPARNDAAPGADIALPVTATAVERPDGSRDDVAGTGSYRLGTVPGIYRVLAGDSTLAAWAVNPPAAESRLERIDERRLRALLPGWTLHVTTRAAAWRGAVFRERLGRELWRPLLFVLLAVLIVETIVAAAGRARRVESD
ncbi:hypothetical protein BH23GEM10_BH23GEM10_08070 [soil metagenome]